MVKWVLHGVFSQQRKSHHIIDGANYSKTENEHGKTLPELTVSQKNYNERNVRECCTNYGKHPRYTSNPKPEKGFFDPNEPITH